MGITTMENFDVADLASLTGDPHNIVIAPHAGMNTLNGLKTFTEKGARRTSYYSISNTYDGSGSAYGKILRIPLPIPPDNLQSSKTYYLSFRVRILTGAYDATAAVSKILPNTTVGIFGSTFASYAHGGAYNVFGITSGSYIGGGDANKLRLFVGRGLNATTSMQQFTPGADGFFHIEVYKPANSTKFTVWLNDFMYVAPTDPTQGTGAANTDANMYFNIFFARSQTYFNGAWGIEVTDVIVIDPTTPGQQYRLGSTGRVLSMDYTSDITNDWASSPSATLSHSQMMMIDKNPPDAANILTGTVIGQREQYGVTPIPSEFGPYVPAVKLQPRIMNGGAAAHSVAMEMDWGAGLTEVGTKTVVPGGAYDTTPLIMATKPNGDPWTTADFASAKAGFSVKS